jgi:carbonic anhydrase
MAAPELGRIVVKKIWLGFFGAGMATALTAASLHAQDGDRYVSPWRTPWTFQDQAAWGDLDPEYAACKTGRAQSPVAIDHPTLAELPPLQFTWKTAPMRPVANNRFTIRMNFRPGNGNSLTVGAKRYELVQFHFHHPAEEVVDGRRYPMATHLMYKGADGSVVGVAVFDRPGDANPTVQKLWDRMPLTEGQTAASNVEFTPAGLVPADRVRRYDTYMGSITAPPCTEDVRWFILADTMTLSPAQIAAFAKLWPDDARSLQPLNGRAVQRSR